MATFAVTWTNGNPDLLPALSLVSEAGELTTWNITSADSPPGALTGVPLAIRISRYRGFAPESIPGYPSPDSRFSSKDTPSTGCATANTLANDTSSLGGRAWTVELVRTDTNAVIRRAVWEIGGASADPEPPVGPAMPNTVFAGPSSGTDAGDGGFRFLEPADMPGDLEPIAEISGTASGFLQRHADGTYSVASGGGGTQSDWNATTGAAVILNKPTLGTAAAHAATDFVPSDSGLITTDGLGSINLLGGEGKTGGINAFGNVISNVGTGGPQAVVGIGQDFSGGDNGLWQVAANLMYVGSWDNCTTVEIASAGAAGGAIIINVTTQAVRIPGVITAPGGVTGLPAPSATSDAATKAYVDAIAAGIVWKSPALLATTANITLSGEQTIDGVLTSASRVLVKDQSTGSQNGIYTTGSGSWTRTTDASTGPEIVSSVIFVEQGTANADKSWICTNDAITIGSTAIVFVKFGSAIGALLASNNLSDLNSASTARTNLGLGTLATQNGTVPAGTIVGTSDAQTLSNKRRKLRIVSTTSSGTPAINTDVTDVFILTAQAVTITSFTSSLTGTPNDGDFLEVRITGTGTIGITWGASFASTTTALPITTVGTTTLRVLFQWNAATSLWECLAAA